MKQGYYEGAKPEEKTLAYKLAALRVTQTRARLAGFGQTFDIKKETARQQNQIAYLLIFSPPHTNLAKNLQYIAQQAPKEEVADNDLAGWLQENKNLLSRLDEALQEAVRNANLNLSSLNDYLRYSEEKDARKEKAAARKEKAAAKKKERAGQEKGASSPATNGSGHVARQDARKKPTRSRE